MYVWTVASQARFARPVFFSGSCSLFMGPVSTFLKKKTILKLDSTVFFTHLKIILLQYFQFSVFSNKRYPNKP